MRVGEVILRDRGGRRRTGEDHLPRREAQQRVVLVVRFDERSHLRQDVVGGAVGNHQILVARRIRRGEARRRRGQDFEPNDARGHRVDLGKVEHPRIAAGVHGFGQDQVVELGVVLGLADDDAGLIGRARGGCAGDEVLSRLVVELGVSVTGGDLDLLDVVPVVHEGLEECAGAGDFDGGGDGSGDLLDRLGWLRSAAAAAASSWGSAWSRGVLNRGLSRHRDGCLPEQRRLPEQSGCASREKGGESLGESLIDNVHGYLQI